MDAGKPERPLSGPHRYPDRLRPPAIEHRGGWISRRYWEHWAMWEWPNMHTFFTKRLFSISFVGHQKKIVFNLLAVLLITSSSQQKTMHCVWDGVFYAAVTWALRITHLLLRTRIVLTPTPRIKLCAIASYRLFHSHAQVVYKFYWLVRYTYVFFVIPIILRVWWGLVALFCMSYLPPPGPSTGK